MSKYGATLFPLLRRYIQELCEKKASPFRVNTVMQWYRVVVLELFSSRASFAEVRAPDVFPILSDVSTVLQNYLGEKSVVQGCVGTLLVTTESSCFAPPFPSRVVGAKSLEFACSSENVESVNRILALYAHESWMGSFFQYLHTIAVEGGRQAGV